MDHYLTLPGKWRGFAKRDDKRDPPSYNDRSNDELESVVRLSN